jgi:hypothetical protein
MRPVDGVKSVRTFLQYRENRIRPSVKPRTMKISRVQLDTPRYPALFRFQPNPQSRA